MLDIKKEKLLDKHKVPNQPNQNPNPNHDRTGRPVVCSQRASQTRFSRDSTNFNLEEETDHDRTGRCVVCSQAERSLLNEVDIDFRILGLQHSFVKQAENYRVRELVKQIENHPHRQALQHDGQENGVTKADREQAAADSRGSRTCVCANTFELGVAHAEGEG